MENVSMYHMELCVVWAMMCLFVFQPDLSIFSAYFRLFLNELTEKSRKMTRNQCKKLSMYHTSLNAEFNSAYFEVCCVRSCFRLISAYFRLVFGYFLICRRQWAETEPKSMQKSFRVSYLVERRILFCVFWAMMCSFVFQPEFGIFSVNFWLCFNVPMKMSRKMSRNRWLKVSTYHTSLNAEFNSAYFELWSVFSCFRLILAYFLLTPPWDLAFKSKKFEVRKILKKVFWHPRKSILNGP